MPDAKYKISIVTPNFNSGMRLKETCASVAAQKVDYEHLIMDSVSTDGSLELARELAAADARIKLFSEKDKGIFDGFNKGVAKATGDYIYFLGAGDVLLPGCLTEVSRYFSGNKREYLYGDCMMNGRRYDGKFTKRMLVERNICHQGVFYGREVFDVCGSFDQSYFVVADHVHNMICFGSRKIKKKYIPVVVAVYEGGGNSEQRKDSFIQDRLMLVRKHMGEWMMMRLRCEHYWKLIVEKFGG